MAVQQLTDTNFEQDVLKSEKPVLVDFYADWCGPCRVAAPIIEELSEVNSEKMVFGKLDVDTNQQTAAEFGVMSIPTVILFKDGKEIDRKIDFGGREGYEAMIKKVA